MFVCMSDGRQGLKAKRNNKNTEPLVLVVSIFCVTAQCNETLTAIRKADDISRLTSTYLKRKLFLNGEVLVPQQLSVSI